MEWFKFKFSKVQFIRNWNSVYHWETGGASDVAWQLWILLCRFQRFLIPWLLVSSREYDDMISMILSCKIWQYLWWFFVRRSCFCFVFANDNFTKKKQENCPNQIMVFYLNMSLTNNNATVVPLHCTNLQTVCYFLLCYNYHKITTLWKKPKSLCARCPTGRPIKYEPLDIAYINRHKRYHFCGGKILVNFKGNFDIVSQCPNSLGWHPLTLPRPTQVWTKCHNIHITNWSFMSAFGRFANFSNQSTKNVEIHIIYIRTLVNIIILSTWIHLTLRIAKKVNSKNFRGNIFSNSAIFISIYLNIQFCFPSTEMIFFCFLT